MTAETVSPRDLVLESAIRKAARRLLPFLLLLYILAFLDRVNVGYAKQALLRTTSITEAVFAFGASIFFIGYAIFEIPSNLIMHRVGARVWMARIMITWGLVSAAMMFATDARSFYILRFLLGVAEAGFFPGVILYLTYWFPAASRGPMMGLFYFGAPIAQIVGGPLSGLLLDLDGFGGWHGWQIMFAVEGLLASIVGIWVLFYLTSKPADARWLTAAERESLQTAVTREDAAKSHSGKSALRMLGNPRVLYFGLIYLLIQMSVYGVTFYLPSKVAALLQRDTGFVVGLVSAIPWVCALIAAFVLPRLPQARRAPRLLAAVTLLVSAAGIALSASSGTILAMAALCVAAAGFIGAQPIFWTFSTSEFSGAPAAAAIAMINSLGALGGFLAPNVKTFAEHAWASPTAGQLALAGSTVLAALLIAALVRPRNATR